MLWTDAERERLRCLVPRHSVRTIAKQLGRSFSSIRSAIERQRLGRPKLDTWTRQETDLLHRDWPNYSAGVIAQRLGRSRNAVIGKVNRMRRDGVALRLKLPLHGLRQQQQELPRPKPVPPHMKAKPIVLKPHAIQCPCQLVELDDVNCKWPFGDPHTDDFFFCGAIRLDGSPYCPDHHRQAHHETERHHDRSRSALA